MKAFLVVLMAVLLSACDDIVNLNDKIYEIQKQAVLQSPYKSANGTIVYVDAQKEFRLNKLPKLIRSKIYTGAALNDTVFITESFDAICMNCSSDWMKILLRDTIYSVRREILGHKGGITYKMETEAFNPSSKDFQYELRNSEVIEIVSKIRNGQPWTTHPLEYGADNCNDGDHTIFTVMYPDKRIEALYVRCWTPSFYRNIK